MQARINKLRPIRARIEPLVKDVEGFTGIVITSGQLVVLAQTQKAVKTISNIIGRRQKALISVKLLNGKKRNKAGKIVEIL